MLGTIPEQWDEFRVSADEFHEDGDTLIVLCHVRGTAKATGRQDQWPMVQVWRMQDGKARECLTLYDTLVVGRLLDIAG